MKENYIRFDWAMKRLLRDKSNYVVLEGFLSTMKRINLTALIFWLRTAKADCLLSKCKTTVN